MMNRFVEYDLKYKDRGTIVYRVIEGFDNEQDCLVLNYQDDEKSLTWEYHFTEDGKTAFEHIHSIGYEELKRGFVENISHTGYYLQKGEYQLLKEAIVIFVSHKKYIEEICRVNGIC